MFQTSKNPLLTKHGSFVKGTKIHTLDGTKPIELIKAGDYVLSSPRNNQNILENKRVLNTFIYKNEIIMKVNISALDWSFSRGDPIYSIATTSNQLFWVENRGWIPASILKVNDLLAEATSNKFKVSLLQNIYKTETEGVGWTSNGADIENSHGSLFDYSNYQYVKSNENNRYLSAKILESNEPYLSVKVYGLEIEDFNTYYVGERGFWVASD